MDDDQDINTWKGVKVEYWGALGLVLLTTIAFLPVFSANFLLLHDPEYVTENPVVKRGLTWYGIRWSIFSWDSSQWHPITWLSHMLDVSIWGLSPTGHHLTNLVLHIVNATLVFFLLRKMTDRFFLSWLAALIFAIHPVQTESVTWVSARKDLLSAIAAMMAKAAPGNLKSFSIRFEDPSFDESNYARLVAKHLQTEHHELSLTPEIAMELVPKIGSFIDEPLGDSSLIPTYLLSEFTRHHVKVALGGDGGDELFAGYSTLQAHRLVEYYERMLPGFVRHRMIPWVIDRMPVSFDNISFDFKLRRFVAGRAVPPVVRHHQWMGSFSQTDKPKLLKPWAELRERDVYQVAFEHEHNSQAKEDVNRLLYCDLKMYLENDILPKVDRASMANSLEVRVPLLNHTLVEYASQIPHSLKLHGMTTKYILRRALKDQLPKSILARGKKGFNMPVAKWFAGPLRPLVEDMLSESRLKREGYFEPAYVKQLMDEHMSGYRDHRKLLWTLLVFELWHEHWCSSDSWPVECREP